MGALVEDVDGESAVVFDSDGTVTGRFVVNGTSTVCFDAFETFVVGNTVSLAMRR